MDNYTDYKYPHYLEWDKRIWVVKEGEVVKYKGKTYRIKQVMKMSSGKLPPQLTLEEVED